MTSTQIILFFEILKRCIVPNFLQHTQISDTDEIFNNCGVPIWYEDASELYSELTHIENTFGSIPQYIKYHPHIIPQLIDTIKIIEVNNDALSFFNAEKKELCQGIRNYFNNETYNRFFQMIMHLYAGNLSYTYITSKFSKKGRKFITQVTVTIPEKYRHNWSRMIVTEMDVSHFIKSEVQLKRKLESYEQIIDNKNNFASIVSHELKNPFNTILGFSDLLLANFKSLSSKKIFEFIQYIHESAHQSYQLFDNLLEWTSSNIFQASRRFCVVQDIVDDVLNTVKMACVSKEILIEKSIPEEQRVFADVNMLSFVLRNVITNSIKFSYSKSSISITSYTRDAQVYIEVEDSGIGMDADTQGSLFVDDDAVQSRKGVCDESGTGIGLQLCKRFMEKQSGKIIFDTRPHKGTKVTLILPEKERIYV